MNEADTSAAALFCPTCGYDLRATALPRCPECGKPFDPATLAASQIPWVHRRARGRIRTYLHTLCLATFCPWKFAKEISRPVDWQSASRFRWVTIALALIFLAAASTALYPFTVSTYSGHIYEFGWWPSLDASGKITPPPLLWPALALLDTRWVILIFILGLALGLSMFGWWTRTFFWIAARTRPQKERASALSAYVGTPAYSLSLLLTLDIAWKACIEHEMPRPHWLPTAIVALHAALLGWWAIRMLILASQTTHRGVRALFVALVGFATGLLLIIPAGIAIVDYLFGLLAFVYASLR